MQLIPLIGYLKSDPEETSYISHDDVGVRKLWTLVRWRSMVPDASGKDKIGDWHTTEFCIQSRNMFDFCGGNMFFSPQLTHYRQGGWSSGGFCNPGQIALTTGWDDLDDDLDRAVDLAEFTGQEFWAEHEVEEYGLKCIAHACITDLIRSGCRGWIAADAHGGMMKRVHDQMIANRDALVYTSHPVFCSRVTSDYTGNHCAPELDQYNVLATEDSNTTFRNSNSGNEVRWLTGHITSWYDLNHHDVDDYDGDHECENCGYDNDGCDCGECHECGADIGSNPAPKNVFRMPEQIKRCYDNPLFMQQVRRYQWSNG